jgi:hypothetical protein
MVCSLTYRINKRFGQPESDVGRGKYHDIFLPESALSKKANRPSLKNLLDRWNLIPFQYVIHQAGPIRLRVPCLLRSADANGRVHFPAMPPTGLLRRDLAVQPGRNGKFRFF